LREPTCKPAPRVLCENRRGSSNVRISDVGHSELPSVGDQHIMEWPSWRLRGLEQPVDITQVMSAVDRLLDESVAAKAFVSMTSRCPQGAGMTVTTGPRLLSRRG